MMWIPNKVCVLVEVVLYSNDAKGWFLPVISTKYQHKCIPIFVFLIELKAFDH